MARRSSALLLAVSLLTSGVSASARQDFIELDLATLMNMDVTVTSAARRAQSSADAAAAVHVITREDIRRSGAASLPDLLRTVPGLQVARINTRSWAVSARGFSSQFANKLQVLVDGRSIYAAVFSGVMWEEQALPLEQIERIEIIRGPGGALWGVNAMNGVINVITRAANGEEGLQFSAGAGGRVTESAAMRYDALIAGGALQLHADHLDAASFDNDPSDLNRTVGGVSYERALGDDHLELQAQFTKGRFMHEAPRGPTALPPESEHGTVSAGWRREHGEAAFTQLQSHYSWNDRGPVGGWDETVGGVDVQHTFARWREHVLTVGGGFRHLTDVVEDERARASFTEVSVQRQEWSAYFQDETFWFDERVRIIAGAKLEHFEYSGLAFQPTLRALWRASDATTMWVAASRAARSPSRLELHSEVTMPLPMPGPPMLVSISGSEDLEMERLDAYELGWRWRPNTYLTFDLALFHHAYDDLIMQLAQAPRPAPGDPSVLVMPFVHMNAGKAQTQGAELSVEWRIASNYRLQGAAHYLDMDLPIATSALSAFTADPRYAWSLGGRWDVTERAQLDVLVRGVADNGRSVVKGYESLDVRAGWRATERLELSVALENVLDDEHSEFFDEVARSPGVALGRAAFARVHWRPGN